MGLAGNEDQSAQARYDSRDAHISSYFDVTNDFAGMISLLSIYESSWLYDLFQWRAKMRGAFNAETIFNHLRFQAALTVRIISLFMLAVFFGFGPLATTLVIMIAVVVAMVARAMMRPLISSESTLPCSVEELCFRQRIHKDAILDLYMTGTNGRQVAQALLLENLKKTKQYILTTYLCICIAIELVLTLGVFGLRTFGGMIAAFLFAAIAWSFRDYVYIIALQRAARLLETHMARWEGLFSLKSRSGMPLASFFAVILFVNLFFVRFFVPSLLVTFVLMVCFKGWLLRRYATLWMDLIQKSDVKFSIFVTSVLMEDDLGAAWSKWYYGSGRAEATAAVVLSESNEYEPPPLENDPALPPLPITLPMIPLPPLPAATEQAE